MQNPPKSIKSTTPSKGFQSASYMHEPKSMNTDTRIHEYIQKYIQM